VYYKIAKTIIKHKINFKSSLVVAEKLRVARYISVEMFVCISVNFFKDLFVLNIFDAC